MKKPKAIFVACSRCSYPTVTKLTDLRDGENKFIGQIALPSKCQDCEAFELSQYQKRVQEEWLRLEGKEPNATH